MRGKRLSPVIRWFRSRHFWLPTSGQEATPFKIGSSESRGSVCLFANITGAYAVTRPAGAVQRRWQRRMGRIVPQVAPNRKGERKPPAGNASNAGTAQEQKRRCALTRAASDEKKGAGLTTRRSTRQHQSAPVCGASSYSAGPCRHSHAAVLNFFDLFASRVISILETDRNGLPEFFINNIQVEPLVHS
jgi:hypothetical protein